MNAVLRRSVVLAAVAVAIGIPVAAQELPESERSVKDFSAGDVAAAQQLTQTMGVAEWLGPMAPVALSPFFGIACLSGMSLYGQGWISADNAFLGENSPLHNPVVFWVFLGLTLLTSVPRFTKVSKPFAQAIDHVEAWSGIITMVVLKIMMGAAAPDPAQLDVAQMGFLSVSVDTLLIIAAAINIFVINAVKFFFEMLIWITPVPAIDAIFEVVNKTVCGALMVIYGFSPTAATVINLGMFFLCAIVFRWAYRREIFFRTVLMDALRAAFFPTHSVSKPDVCVFPTHNVGPIPARTRCVLRRTDAGWSLMQQRLFRSGITVEIPADQCTMIVKTGWFTNCFHLSGSPTGQLTFSRRFNHCLADLADTMGAENEQSDESSQRDPGDLKAELA